ncbi:MAG: 6,7-dimethyl-8-ribityllumazine synthase [Planctomycetaceae bacterium]
MTKTPPSDPTARPPAGARVAVVAARWNAEIVEGLLAGSLARLGAAGLAGDAVDVVRVPGSFELPLVADRLAAGGRHGAVICLGAIVRGETSHDRHIAAAVAQGVEQAGRARGVPILFGVLTCDTLDQARARSVVPAAGAAWDEAAFARNKGAESAAAAIEMMNVCSRLAPPAR